MDATDRGTAVRHPAVRPPLAGETARPWHIRMRGRDPTEPHRAVTPLELFFDLVFVVALAGAADLFHHALADGEVVYGVGVFLIVFFFVWWPWVQFTHFASAYDTDDVLYRLLTFVQMAGVLVVAAGTERVFEALDFRVVVAGYVIMRIAYVAQLLRVAREDPLGREVALRFAAGIAAIQVLWVLRLAIGPPLGIALVFVLGAGEMLIPIWAERSGRPTPWHPGHVAERVALFTIIVLGECVFAATSAVRAATEAGAPSMALIMISVGGLLLVFAMWWSYFKAPAEITRLTELRGQFAWGYGHFVIFSAVVALGSGLQVAVEAVAEPEHVSALTAGMAVGVPTALYAGSVAVLHRRGRPWREMAALAVGAVFALAIGATAPAVGVPVAVLAIGLLFAALVGWRIYTTSREVDAVGFRQADEEEAVGIEGSS